MTNILVNHPRPLQPFFYTDIRLAQHSVLLRTHSLIIRGFRPQAQRIQLPFINVQVRDVVQIAKGEILPDTHKRKCPDCGTTSEHQDTVTPWVLCPKCGSRDTRRLTKSDAEREHVKELAARAGTAEIPADTQPEVRLNCASCRFWDTDGCSKLYLQMSQHMPPEMPSVMRLAVESPNVIRPEHQRLLTSPEFYCSEHRPRESDTTA
jgi:DNA-directed RNA polymerase subunit RPC12/RpoP